MRHGYRNSKGRFAKRPVARYAVMAVYAGAVVGLWVVVVATVVGLTL